MLRNPESYGGHEAQPYYIQKRDEVIATGIQMIRETLESQGDLKELYSKISDVFGKVRHEIAVTTKSDDAENFGRKRLEHSVHNFYFTPLNTPDYQEYNQKFLSFLKGALKDKIPVSGPLQPIPPIEDIFLGRKCSVEFQLFIGKEVQDLGWRQPPSYLQRCIWDHLASKVVKDGAIKAASYPPTEEEQQFIKELKDHFKKVKEQNPVEYEQIKMQDLFTRINSAVARLEAALAFMHLMGPNFGISPPPQLIFIKGVVKLEIEGEMCPLSEYFTWTYQDYQTDPVSHLDNSSVWITHLDQFLIPDVRRECTRLFEQAVLWKSTDEKKALTDPASLLRYLEAPMMEDARGSAAKAEWFDLLIYRYHDPSSQVRHDPKKMGDLEALTAPLLSRFDYLSTLGFLRV